MRPTNSGVETMAWDCKHGLRLSIGVEHRVRLITMPETPLGPRAQLETIFGHEYDLILTMAGSTACD